MIDFDTAWAEQDDLAALLQPRQSASQEIYWPNNNYGAARVLKEYAGYPLDKPLFAIVPHGVYLLVDRAAPPLEAQAPLPAILSFPQYVDEAYRRSTSKLVIPSAAPFLYALARLGNPGQRSDASGTIFFPMHSTARVRIEAPLDEVAEKLTLLPAEYQPVTVCTHWYDYSIGLHEPFARRGMRIVSAGHLHDDDFMYRLAHLMTAHRYVASNAVASNLFYAVAAGMPYWVMDSEWRMDIAPDFPAHAYSAAREADMDGIKQMFSSLPAAQPTQLQRDTAMAQLGGDRFKPASGLLADLQLAERRAKYGM